MPGPRVYYIGFILIFSVFWLVFKIGGIANVPEALISFTIDITVCIAAMFCTVNYLLPSVFYTRRYPLFSLLFAGIIITGGSTIILLQLRLHGNSPFNYRESVARSTHFFYWFWSDLIFGSYFIVFMIATGGAAIRFAFDRLQALNNVQQLEKEKLQSELDRLRNQINPHFLFNALNTINYKIDRSNQPARETLQRFSKMLRYQLYECEKPFIEVDQELRFLLSYIELQKERMNENYNIRHKGFEEVNGLYIAPFLLLPIIENAFKHVSQWADRENEINLECRRENNTFILFTSNSCAESTEKNPAGIGLKNITKQMDLLYPGLYKFEIKRTTERFELCLQMELKIAGKL